MCRIILNFGVEINKPAMKYPFFFAAMLTAVSVDAQSVTYDFSQDPVTTGWTFVNTGGGTGMSYSAASDEIVYDITTGNGNNFMYHTLPFELKDQFCVQFRIRPTLEDGYNTFFPLLLAPHVMTGSDLHPWRTNPVGGVPGSLQDLDLIGVEIKGIAAGNEIRFISRDGNNASGSPMIVSFSSPFYMEAHTDYWVLLERVSGTSARLSVYADATLTNQLRTQLFTIPDVEPMNAIYLSNGNGNNYTTQTGALDDYTINDCRAAGAEEAVLAYAKLFPNPAYDVLTLEWQEGVEVATILVLDATGREVLCLNPQKGESSALVDIGTLVSGSYTVKFGDTGIVRQLVKQ
jgi:hypothetical protein